MHYLIIFLPCLSRIAGLAVLAGPAKVIDGKAKPDFYWREDRQNSRRRVARCSMPQGVRQQPTPLQKSVKGEVWSEAGKEQPSSAWSGP
jgi:hypothetical protein